MNINKSNNTQPPQNEEDENTIQNITEGTIANLHCWGFGKYGQVGKQFISYSIDPIYIQIDYENQDINGKILDVIPDIIIEEFLIYVMLI